MTLMMFGVAKSGLVLEVFLLVLDYTHGMSGQGQGRVGVEELAVRLGASWIFEALWVWWGLGCW